MLHENVTDKDYIYIGTLANTTIEDWKVARALGITDTITVD